MWHLYFSRYVLFINYKDVHNVKLNVLHLNKDFLFFNAAKIECAHMRAHKLLTDYNHWILTFHSIYDYFALLKAFNTNTIHFHKYFKLCTKIA